jgi:hypothetical protein
MEALDSPLHLTASGEERDPPAPVLSNGWPSRCRDRFLVCVKALDRCTGADRRLRGSGAGLDIRDAARWRRVSSAPTGIVNLSLSEEISARTASWRQDGAALVSETQAIPTASVNDR